MTDATLKARLLEQACSILVRDGADALTARTLAREAGVSVGVLYNHFPDMSSILLEVVTNALAQSASKVAEAVERCASRPLESFLAEVGAVMLDDDAVAIAHAVFVRPNLAERVRIHLVSTGTPAFGEVEDLVQAELVRRDPRLESGHASAAARMFVGLIHEVLRTGPYDEDRAGELATAARLLATGLTAQSPGVESGS